MSKGATTSEVTLPKFQEEAFKDLYAAGRSVAQQPFIPYTGPMVAGFNPDQLRQFEATRGIFERQQQFRPEAGLQELAQQPLDIASYQSPYQQQVIDLAMQDIQRQQDIAQGQAQDRAIGAGAFGGSRSAILESEAARPFIEQKARTAAGLRQAGFEQAQRAAQQQQQFRANLLGDQYARQLGSLGLLGGIGAQQQALQQQALGAARGEFERAVSYPQQQLATLTGAFSGVPTLAGQFQKKKTGPGDVLAAAADLGGSYLLGKG